MIKLSLVIADKDKAYVENLVGFLMDKHFNKFQVSSFANENYLLEYLQKHGSETDILLINTDIYNKLKEQILIINTTLIFLSNSKTILMSGLENVVYKYQHINGLVSDIFKIYEKKNNNLDFMLNNYNKTRLISIYSPIGGSGKTTIAASACINCAREGMKVFYINLESINSTYCFFTENTKEQEQNNLSNIIFAIKEKDSNLGVKIEGTKLTDITHDIHYLPPPDSPLEIDEILPEEIKYLLSNIKQAGLYNIIFADLSNDLNLRNIAVMEESDEIILIYTPSYISKIKIISFCSEINNYQKRKGINIMNKITLVVNKFDEHIIHLFQEDINEICSMIGKEKYIKISLNNQIQYRNGIFPKEKATDFNNINSIGKELMKLTHKYSID